VNASNTYYFDNVTLTTAQKHFQKSGVRVRRRYPKR
jgi:hypothetical protein